MNQKRKKGFTLIELLAVIVILAIIALIAVPVIMNIINKANKSAFKDTAYGIIQAGELYFAEQQLELNGMTQDVTITLPDSRLQMKGDIPEGKVTITADGKVSIAVQNGRYCVTKGLDDTDVTVTDDITNCNLPSENGGSGLVMNEYGFYFGVPYVTYEENKKGIFTFFEDGSVNMKIQIAVPNQDYMEGTISATYSLNKITLIGNNEDGALVAQDFTVTENGTKLIGPDGSVLTLETTTPPSNNDGDTLTWDGNGDGLVSVAFSIFGDGSMFYRVSDEVPTVDDCVNGVSITTSNGDAIHCTYNEVKDIFDDVGIVTFDAVIVIPSDNFMLAGLVYPKAGIYFVSTPDFYVSSLTINGYDGF